MFRPLTFALTVSTLLGAESIGRAASITYDFTGDFDWPMNGTTQFSGSFTFNLNPTPSNVGAIDITQDVISQVGSVSVAQPVAYSFYPVAAAAAIAEYGNDVSLTVNMGGQVIHYANTPQNPYLATFEAWLQRYPYSPQGTPPPIDVVRISGITTLFSPGNSFSNNSFSFSFTSPTDTLFKNLAQGQVANLGTFAFATTFNGLSAADPSGGSYSGTITSIEAVSVPESSTLIIFAVLGIAAKVLRSCRKG